MSMTRKFRVGAGIAGVVAAGLLLGGCIGGPTYGTDKTAGEHLMDDLGSIASIGAANKNADKNIKYQPRPGLVLPPEDENLVQPQQSLASKENPQWVESPEDTRLRLKAEATENEDNPFYKSPLANRNANGIDHSAQGQKAQTEAYREARRLQQGLYSDKRRSLSDPPLDYRRLPEGAEADLGEPEKKKERRRKKEAEIAKSGKPWWQFF